MTSAVHAVLAAEFPGSTHGQKYALYYDLDPLGKAVQNL